MARKRPVIELPDPLTVAILRGKSPEERLRMSFGMWNTARILVRGTLRQEHPDWTEEEILRESAHRLSHGATRRVGSRPATA